MKPIFLIGFMGSGKTTLGKKLAKKLNLPFVDLDHVFVDTYQQDIPSFFQLYGENQFRIAEREILKKHAQVEAVISTGGGTPCYFDNMDWILENGLAIYLYHTPASLYARLKTSKIDQRPALKNLSEEQLRVFIVEKLSERAIYYERAQLKIDQLHSTVDELVEILKPYQIEKPA